LIRRDPSRRLVVRINVYNSAAYAPLLQMREQRLLENALPGLSVEWKVIPAAETVNQALREGGVDLATGAPTAFLLARAAGLPVKLVGGIGATPCTIVGRVGLRSLAGIRATDRIAVPDETSLEAAVLQLAALREIGDAQALNGTMVTRAHADALPAIKLGGELTAHVSVTPYLDVELDGAGPTRLVDSRDLFGGLPTAAVAYALPSLREHSGPILDAFSAALGEAVRLAASDLVGTARLLAETEELHATPDAMAEILARSGWQLAPPLTGVTRLADLWRRTGRLRTAEESWTDLAFDGVRGN
jgi:NitT/TauT family transport system substrate-binding protein